MTSSLFTERLALRPGSAVALRAELEGREALASTLAVEVPASWPPELYDADAVKWTLGQIGERPDGGPFGFYHVILRSHPHRDSASNVLIGVGGFKGPPDERGEVELGYGVLPEYRRRGYATEAVRAWVALAFADARVQTVVAQTLASLVPSIGVLEKAGFRHVGAGTDSDAPAGEQVVRYELRRNDAHVATSAHRSIA